MPEQKTLKSKALFRDFSLDRTAVDEEARTVSISFSSEHPVERWFGTEVLDHAPESVNLGRLNDGAPLLLGHSWDDQIGVVENASIGADKVGRALVRFGRSARAQEILQDVIDGIRTKISVGYRIDEMVLEKSDKESGNTYRATRWTPHEISIVPIPADPNVGVGRGAEVEHEIIVRGLPGEAPKEESPEEERIMPEVTVNVEEVRKVEAAAVREIIALGEKCGCREDALKFIQDGKSPDDFRQFVLESKWGQQGGIREVQDTPDLGLTDKEARSYSFLRALNAAANGDWKNAGFELECSRAAAAKMKRDPQGFFIPHDVLTIDGKRDYLSVGLTNHTGEKTVATELLAGSFIEMLRNSMMVKQMGARTLAGLVGDIAIPRQTGGATAYWLSEDADTTGSLQTFDQLTMTPKTVAGMTQVTRKLLQQSSLDVENLIRQDLATVLALAIDAKALHGDGQNNTPTGIASTSGIATVAIGATGGAPTLAHLIDMETEVAVDNALFGSMGYLTNAKVRGKLKKTYPNTTGGDTAVWQNMPGNPGWGELNGYRAGVSNQVASNLSKSSGTNLSAIFFGNWADLIVGMWGGMDVIVDPYSGSSSGRLKIVMFQDLDFLVRHAESFSIVVDAATA